MRITRRHGSALLIGAVLALSACEGTADQPEPRSSASSPAAAGPTLPAATPDPAVAPFTVASKPRWTTAPLRLGKAESVTVVGATSVVAFESGPVAAVGTATGKVRWSYRDGERFEGGQGQELAFGSNNGPVTDSTRGPIVLVEYYYSGSTPNQFGLAALSVATGRLVWAEPLQARGSLTHDWEVRVVGASRDGIVVQRASGGPNTEGSYPSDDIETVVLDPATGRTRWRVAGIAPTTLAGTTVVAIGAVDGEVNARGGAAGGPLQGRDLRTGRTLWQRPATELADYLSTGDATRRSVVTELNGRTRLLDAASGRTISTTIDDCMSDGTELLACLPRGERLVTYAATDGVVGGAGALGSFDVVNSPAELVQVESGRIFLRLADGKTLAVDRAGRALAIFPMYRFHSASAGYVVLATGQGLGLYATTEA